MKTMTLAQFIPTNSAQIIAEWEQFARTYVSAARKMDFEGRRDHVQGMLEKIAKDIAKPQTEAQQASKSKGTDDGQASSATAANSHGTDRAATGFSPVDVVSEFRALAHSRSGACHRPKRARRRAARQKATRSMLRRHCSR